MGSSSKPSLSFREATTPTYSNCQNKVSLKRLKCAPQWTEWPLQWSRVDTQPRSCCSQSKDCSSQSLMSRRKPLTRSRNSRSTPPKLKRKIELKLKLPPRLATTLSNFHKRNSSHKSKARLLKVIPRRTYYSKTTRSTCSRSQLSPAKFQSKAPPPSHTSTIPRLTSKTPNPQEQLALNSSSLLFSRSSTLKTCKSPFPPRPETTKPVKRMRTRPYFQRGRSMKNRSKL
jgi:hypothetical protein